jgi:signal transduction protein with GAF and PtsI domain
LEEIGNLAQEGGKPAETLMNVVALIAKRFLTDVCSAYLLEPDRANLVLAATVGLRRECIGTLRMALHEGLAGLVAEQVRPIAVEQVKQHPRFKYFRESGEEAYQSFLGVPLVDRGVLQGVLVVQTIEAREFGDDDIRMLMEAAAEVGPVWTASLPLHRRNSGPSRATCGGAGIRIPTASSAIWIRCAGAPSITIPSRC